MLCEEPLPFRGMRSSHNKYNFVSPLFTLLNMSSLAPIFMQRISEDICICPGLESVKKLAGARAEAIFPVRPGPCLIVSY